MSPTKRKYLNFVLLCLLAIALLWWFGRKLDWLKVRAAAGQANWILLAFAVLIVCVAYLLRAYRWRALLAPLAKLACWTLRCDDHWVGAVLSLCVLAGLSVRDFADA